MALRAYQRFDPRLFEKKALEQHYPAGAFVALVGAINLAEAQSQRGRFRSERVLRALLDKYGRWIPFLVTRGDLTVLSDGRLYVDGWDEWQEGDWRVKERVDRIRHRKRTGPTVPPVTPETDTPATLPSVSTPSDGHRQTVAVSAKRDSPSVGTSGSGGESNARDPDDLGSILTWLARERSVSVPEGAAMVELARLVDQHGPTAVIEALAAQDRRMKDGRQFVYGALHRLNPLPSTPRNAKHPNREYRPTDKEAADAFERF